MCVFEIPSVRVPIGCDIQKFMRFSIGDSSINTSSNLDSLISRLFADHFSRIGPDSLCIETLLSDRGPFLSRFPLYRDTSFCWRTFSVPIPPVSGHIFLLEDLFCPDSPCIGTLLSAGGPFLSRFHLYRDTSFFRRTFSVPIPPVSRHTFLPEDLFCPDSPCFETHLSDGRPFCPDSLSIETQISSSSSTTNLLLSNHEKSLQIQYQAKSLSPLCLPIYLFPPLTM